MSEAPDENDLDFAIMVFRAGTQIDKEVIVSAHTVEYGPEDKMAVGTAKASMWL